MQPGTCLMSVILSLANKKRPIDWQTFKGLKLNKQISFSRSVRNLTNSNSGHLASSRNLEHILGSRNAVTVRESLVCL